LERAENLMSNTKIFQCFLKLRRLLKPLLDKGYCLKVDNFYTSPKLADILISHTTDVYGTVEMTRKDMPPSGKSKKLKKGEGRSSGFPKAEALQWRDKKNVLLSTIHNAKMVDVEDGQKKKMKLQVVTDYNDTMSGVDLLTSTRQITLCPENKEISTNKRYSFIF
jgi:hypothetical protein